MLTKSGRLAPTGRSVVLAALAIAMIGCFAIASITAGTADASGKKPAGKNAKKKTKKKAKKPNTAKVMTRNVYLGADLGPAINSSGAADFVSKNGQILRDVDANNYKARAKSLAKEIRTVAPDLIGLQEVALWRTGEASLTPSVTGQYVASTVHVDYLDDLMTQLNKGKKRYRVVKVQNEFDFEAPADYDNDPATGATTLGGEINGRLTMRDVILAKTGASVKTRKVKSGNFKTIYKPVISGIPVDVQRGWLSADVKIRKGKWFRFVNTHLEAFGEPAIREAQAKELVAAGGPLRSGAVPGILVGDLNSDDKTVSTEDALAFNALKKRGVVDRGTKRMTYGVTSGIITADAPAKFRSKIDHVMTNRPKSVKLIKSGVTGTKPIGGWWPSDHLGVWSNLRIP